MDEVEFSSKLEYIVNILEIPLNTFLNKPTIINQLESLKELYEYCNENNIDFNDISNWTFSCHKIKRIKETIEVCKINGIEIKKNKTIFQKSADEIQRIIEVCKINGIKAEGTIFQKSAVEIQKIIEICKTNKIEITSSVFQKKSQELNETINYLKQNYGTEYLKSLLIKISVRKIKEVFPYLDSIGILPIVINSASILQLTLDEIIERKELLDYLGEPMVVGKRYNSIFGLSKKNYQKKLNELNIDSVKKR